MGKTTVRQGSLRVLLLSSLLLACSSDDRPAHLGADGGDPSGDGGGAQGHSGQGAADGGGTGDAGLPDLPGLSDLRITPTSRSIVDDGVGKGNTTTFQAMGKISGKEQDVSTKVSWTLEDPALGTIVDGKFTSAGIGGATKVHARALGFDATADLEVKLELTFNADGAPAGIVDLFDADPKGDMVVDDDTLRIVYPSHETMFPRNLERVDHQWRADAAIDRFEVRFESDVADIRYYTADKHFLPDAKSWAWLANTHAGRSLTMSVRGVASASPATVVRSKAITLYYSAAEVPGALYYWSTGAQGVLKATISSEYATKFFTDPEGTDTTCVSCHTVSRNGQRLSAGYGGEVLRSITIPARDVKIPTDTTMKGPAYGWGTFNPDASRLLYANKGVLAMLDSDDGSKIFDVDLAGKLATHPDWAPNGKHVAVAFAPVGKLDNKNVTGTSIARLPVDAKGMLGAAQVLRASADATDTLFFPSYSPDSKWIAFVRATGKSKDNVTSTLYLLPAAGGEPIEIARLNTRVRHEDGIVDIGNSMPTWAPSTKPGIFWLAFSSLRAYGDVLAAGRDQLWAAAIDPEKIGSGKDASYAAFWLPFQDQMQGNHRAFWAIDTSVECPSTIEICDDLDNDCDGVVDEDCCTPEAAEKCGDGKDNDCDGIADEDCCTPKAEVCNGKDDNCNLVVDESCGCLVIDTCGNGKDDDCDMAVDEGCVD